MNVELIEVVPEVSDASGGGSLRRCPNCFAYTQFTKLGSAFTGGGSCCSECFWIILDSTSSLMRRAGRGVAHPRP